MQQGVKGQKNKRRRRLNKYGREVREGVGVENKWE